MPLLLFLVDGIFLNYSRILFQNQGFFSKIIKVHYPIMAGTLLLAYFPRNFFNNTPIMVKTNTQPSPLPMGWKCIGVKRKRGQYSGKIDKHYYAPTGQCFRSMRAAKLYLASVVQPMDQDVVDPPVAVPTQAENELPSAPAAPNTQEAVVSVAAPSVEENELPAEVELMAAQDVVQDVVDPALFKVEVDHSGHEVILVYDSSDEETE